MLYKAANGYIGGTTGTATLFNASGVSESESQRSAIFKDKFAILPPATDANPSNHLEILKSGEFHITKALECAKNILNNDNDKKHESVLIPIAQSRSYLFGLVKRAHWTYLQVDRDPTDPTKVTATHHDSKGFFSRLYPLKYIKEAVSTEFPKASFNTIYTGHQGIRDNHNCGRFVLSSIKNTIAPEQMTNDLNTEFEHIDRARHTLLSNPQQQNVRTGTKTNAAQNPALSSAIKPERKSFREALAYNKSNNILGR